MYYRMYLTRLQIFLIRLIAGRDRAIMIGWKLKDGKLAVSSPEFSNMLIAHCHLIGNRTSTIDKIDVEEKTTDALLEL